MTEPTQQQPATPKRPNAFLKYSGMTTQMAITIGLAVWAGIKLDQKFPNNYHAWTLTMSMAGVGIAMYMVIKDLLKK
jgi:ATP synthase protein I